jgi:hypothetical protein
MEILHIYTARFGDVSVSLPWSTIVIYLGFYAILGILQAMVSKD